MLNNRFGISQFQIHTFVLFLCNDEVVSLCVIFRDRKGVIAHCDLHVTKNRSLSFLFLNVKFDTFQGVFTVLVLIIIYYYKMQNLHEGQILMRFIYRQVYRQAYRQVIPVACMGLIIGACSSSSETPLDQSLDAGSDIATLASVPLDDGNAGATGSAQITDPVSGDTAGILTEGVGTTGGGSDIVGAVAVPAMQGEWITGCLQRGSIFSRQTLSVVGARMLTELSAYSDQACSIPVSAGAGIDGSTIQRNATTVPTGFTRPVSLGDAMEINLYFEEATVDNKPLTTDDSSELYSYIEKVEYDIVLEQNDVLYFGDKTLDEYAGNSADSRPVTLNTLSIYTRLP